MRAFVFMIRICLEQKKVKQREHGKFAKLVCFDHQGVRGQEMIDAVVDGRIDKIEMRLCLCLCLFIFWLANKTEA